MEELSGTLPLHTVHVGYSNRESLFLFAYKPDIKRNVHDQVQESLHSIQNTLGKVLKIRMAFLTGRGCDSPEGLKQMLSALVSSEEQRFYLTEGEIAKWQPDALRAAGLFTHYDSAGAEAREALIAKDEAQIVATAVKWEALIRESRYPSNEVRDWVLKLLIDLRLKLHALLYTSSATSAETLHKEIVQFDSLWGLFQWLKSHLRSYITVREEGTPASKRREVTEAYNYVSLHLGRRITLEEVAAHLHMNHSYFSRFFKKETGMTFIEYVTRKKIERAKELLDQTSHSVNEICMMLGYDNQSYFIKTFKTQAGVTPTEYRG
jgi:two-component system, response regulator YesN